MKNEVKIALNICTFQREEFIHRNLSLLPLHRHHKIFDKYVSDSGRCQCGIQIQIFQSRQIVNCSCHSV